MLLMGLAVAGVVALFLPLVSVTASFSYYGYSTGSNSASVSLFDYLSKTDGQWIRFFEIDLMIFGTVLAVLASLRRLGASASSTALILGFAAMAGGAIWLLAEWNSQVSQLSMFSSSITASQGVGLWIMLGAGVAGVLVCLNDRTA
jgi:hypothetical protein